MGGFKFIEETLAEKNINTDEHIWHELANTATEFGEGWHEILIEMISKIADIYKKQNVDVAEFRIDQIKEKYGGLRVSVRSSIMDVHEIITEYENRSERVCEECGGEGSLHDKNEYLLTLCDACASQMGYKKVE